MPWLCVLVQGVAIVGSILPAVGMTPSAVVAQTFGAQVSHAQDASVLYDGKVLDTQLGLGGRLELPLFGLLRTGVLANARIVASLDRFFPDCDSLLGGASGCSYWEFNADLAAPLSLGSVEPYVGGGLNVGRTRFTSDAAGPRSFSDTELGLNLLGGLRFSLGAVTPFAEARAELSGGEQFVLTGGVLIGG
jgi:hypothetical protein